MAAGNGIELGGTAWRGQLARRLAAAGAVGGRRLALGQIVSGPAGAEAASWTVLVGGGEPAAVLEGTEAAEVCLVSDPETARRLAAGETAAPLLAEGRIKVRGDAAALLESQEALAGLASALRGLPCD